MLKSMLALSAMSAALAGAGNAGGIDRLGNDYGVLFQSGTHLAFTTAAISPRVSGTYPAQLGGGTTGSMTPTYHATQLAIKADLTDRLSFAIIQTDAYGAQADYRQGAYAGLAAKWTSDQTSFVLRYALSDRISVYGGGRHVKSGAVISVPDQLIRPGVAAALQQAQSAVGALTTANIAAPDPRLLAAQTQVATLNAILASPVGALRYDALGAQHGEWGYIVGAAYEVPDIALRVALTYESALTHSFRTTETLPGFGVNQITTTKVEMPQSLTLDLQSGVAPRTLVFGQIKWTEWSAWHVRTKAYDAVANDEITGFADDVISYRLGIGHQFTDSLSGFAQIRYEKANGGPASRLSPTDGKLGLTVGTELASGPFTVQAGLEYTQLGDATDFTDVSFTGNDALSAGMSFKLTF